MADVNTIKEYLVGLGFSVDQPTYRKFKQTLDDASREVESHTADWAKSYVRAAVTITTALTGITVATAGLLEKISQADLEYKKFALRMYMGADAAKKMKIATDALGESLDDIAWIPELRQRYAALVKQEGQMQPGGDFEQQMKRLRDIRFEFTRLRVEMVYGSQWVGQYLMKYLNSPISSFHGWMQRLNDYITEKMPIWTEKVARFLTTMVNLGGSAWRALTNIGEAIKNLWDRLPDSIKKKGLLAALLGFAFLPGPLQAVRILTTLIALVDDFYAYIDGRKSSKTLAPIWRNLLIELTEIKNTFGAIFEAIGFASKGEFSKAHAAIKAGDARHEEIEMLREGAQEKYVEQKRLEYMRSKWNSWYGDMSFAPTTSKQTNAYIPGMNDSIRQAEREHKDELEGVDATSRAEFQEKHKKAEEIYGPGVNPGGGGRGVIRTPGGWIRGSRKGLSGISRQESGGNYYIPNKSGSGAYGKYQIIPSTWRRFAPMAGLSPMAPKTPENQEKVAAVMYEYYSRKYGGDDRLIAAAWYGGEGVANSLQKGRMSKEAFTRKQKYGGHEYPSIDEYIRGSTGRAWDLSAAGGGGGMKVSNVNHVTINLPNVKDPKEAGRAVKAELDKVNNLAAARAIREAEPVFS